MESGRKRRIFVAIKISGPLQGVILDFEKRLQNLSVRWLAGKNLHLTLIPPWYEADVEKALAKMKNIEVPPFDFSFTKVVYGPAHRHPRLIWAEGEAPTGLIKLKKLLENALGQKSGSRPFLLHLTLARFRPVDFSRFSIKNLNEEVYWSEKAESFVLMESHLSRAGADYEVLGEFGFAGK